MTGDDHAPRRHGGRLRPVQVAQPGRLLGRPLGVRPLDLVPLSEQPADQRAGGAYVADGLRGRRCTSTRSAPAPNCRRRPRSRLDYDDQLATVRGEATRASRPGDGADALRRLERLGDASRRSSSRTGSGSTRTTTTTPASWIGGSKPGFMTGGGFPMRFADLDGTTIDVYQADTNMTDESGQTYPCTVNSLLDKRGRPEGYYGAFRANMHTDHAESAGSDAIVDSALGPRAGDHGTAAPRMARRPQRVVVPRARGAAARSPSRSASARVQPGCRASCP